MKKEKSIHFPYLNRNRFFVIVVNIRKSYRIEPVIVISQPGIEAAKCLIQVWHMICGSLVFVWFFFTEKMFQMHESFRWNFPFLIKFSLVLLQYIFMFIPKWN